MTFHNSLTAPPEVYLETGNSNTGFTVDREFGFELGSSAKTHFPDIQQQAHPAAAIQRTRMHRPPVSSQ
jgi:hypothetical protein